MPRSPKSKAKKGVSEMVPLDPRFQPGPYDVVCARGKQAKDHEGNRHYRKLVADSLRSYDKAATKLEKSLVVSRIIETVRGLSPDGGFIKYEDGRWYEVGDHLAREKVGQSLRDSLFDKYSSSTEAKKVRRKREMQVEVDKYCVNRFKDSNQSMAEKVETVASRKESPDKMAMIFNDLNMKLLNQIKQNEESGKQPPSARITWSERDEFDDGRNVDNDADDDDDGEKAPPEPAGSFDRQYSSFSCVGTRQNFSLQGLMAHEASSADASASAAHSRHRSSRLSLLSETACDENDSSNNKGSPSSDKGKRLAV